MRRKKIIQSKQSEGRVTAFWWSAFIQPNRVHSLLTYCKLHSAVAALCQAKSHTVCVCVCVSEYHGACSGWNHLDECNACLGSASAGHMTVIMQVKFHMHAQADICPGQTMKVIAPELINTRINCINHYINIRVLNLSHQLSHRCSQTTYIYTRITESNSVRSKYIVLLIPLCYLHAKQREVPLAKLWSCCADEKRENTSFHCQLEKLSTTLT